MSSTVMRDPSPDRWHQIEQLYHEALAHDASTRDDFLAAACAGDEVLRDEVASLLDYAREADQFLERPLVGGNGRRQAGGATGASGEREDAGERPSLAGRQLGGYDVVSLLGAGGMGEVYRARDVRLGREVALKVLEPSIAADPAYRQRFDNEARSASLFNHPNIVTIYAVGEEGDIAFIAMELVEGRTLRELMTSPMPVEAALETAVQLTSALAAAHGRGIVHRDLKPENVMMTPAGLVKVLDFGVAKRHDIPDGSAGPGDAREPGGATLSGTIVGTVGYMSPEQAAGRSAGPASDQFAFGAILYEMLSGRRAFQRDSKGDTIAAIIGDEPAPIRTFNPHVPASVRRLIARCLAKDPGDRFADTRELDDEVRRIRDRLARGLTRRHVLWIAAGAATAAAAGISTWKLWPPHTLAVLPFANSARDDRIDYLCLGIAESLIGRMKHLPIAVKSFSVASHFAAATADPRTIGRQLNVETVVAGSVALQAGRLDISAALVDVASGATLWSSRYQGSSASIFKLWDEIATAIVDDGLHLRLTREERRALLNRPTDNVEAYDLFLRARPYQMQTTEEDYVAARVLLERAVTSDPRFAEASLALAGTYWTFGLENFMAPYDASTNADRYLRAAAAVNSRLADLPFGRGILAFFFDWDWHTADSEWRAAWNVPDKDMQPELLLPYALARWAAGDPPQALRIVRRARTLDPLSPIFMLHEASYLLYDGEHDQAAERCLSVIEVHRENAQAYFTLADIRYAQQRFDDAIAARRRAHALRGDDEDEELAEALAGAKGREGYAQIEETAVRRLEIPTLARRARNAYVSPLDFARAYAQLGDADRVFEYLDQALAERSPGLVFLNVDRAWEPVRSEPMFKAAVRRVGVPGPSRT